MARGAYRQVTATLTACLAAMGVAISYGWSSPVLPKLLQPGSIIPMTPDEASWIVVCMELGSLFTSIPAGIILDKIGRKNSLLMCGPLSLLSWLLVIFTRSVPMLYISKLLHGSCMGIVLCVIPMYITEVSQPNIRGLLSTLLVSLWNVGFIIAYTLGSYTSYETNAYVSLVLSCMFVVPFWFEPESPYYYVMKNQLGKAREAMAYLRNVDQSEVSEDLKAVIEYVQEEKQNRASFSSLFRDSISLRCLIIMEVICATTVFTGLTTAYAYASQIFSKTSGGTLSADMSSILLSVLFLLANCVATVLIDKTGRRVLILVSCIGSFISTLLAAVFFYVSSETTIDVSSFSWVPLAVIGGYCCFVSIGLNPLATSFQGEIFPANTRSIASGFIACSIAIMSSSCLKTFYLIDTYIGMYFNYVVFTVFAGVGGVVLYYHMPETKDKTFAQIQRELNRKYDKHYVEGKLEDEKLTKPINA